MFLKFLYFTYCPHPFSFRTSLFIKRPFVLLYSYFHYVQTCLIHTSKIKKENMLILKFYPGMKCLHVFFVCFFIPGWNFIPVFLTEMSSSQDEISSGQKLVHNKRVFTREISCQDETSPVYGEMSLAVYTFLSRWNFIPEWTYHRQKDRNEISSEDEKRKKRRVNTSSQDEIIKWACFFNFWRIYSNMLSKVNVFEHNESMNIIKHKA